MNSLVYVWLGDHLPSWARISLLLAKKNSGLSTLLISSRKVGAVPEVGQQIFLEDFYCQSDVIKSKYSTKKASFRDAFWIKTTERFFVLEQFMRKFSYESIFHAELDNLVFNISLLGANLDLVGSGLFCPRDSIARGIASLIYVNNIDALVELSQEAVNSSNAGLNDMELFGKLLQSSKYYFGLPTEAAFNTESSGYWNYVKPDISYGIFDSAAIGQFLFGIDPKNIKGPLYNGFENENKGYDLWRLKYSIDIEKGIASITNKDTSESKNLYNIHVHSKLFHQLIDSDHLKSILFTLDKGDKTLMSVNHRPNRFVRFLNKLTGNHQ